MSEKFPLDVELKNLIAVGYLLMGQNKLAKKELLEVGFIQILYCTAFYF